MSTTRLEKAKALSTETGIGLRNCVKAYDYAKGDHDVAVAYLKAKTLAVATPGLSFDERVQRFLEKDREAAMAQKVKPVKLEKRIIKDILPGEIFTISEDTFVMIEPMQADAQSMASVLLVESKRFPNSTNIKCVINNGDFAYVKVSEDAKNKEQKESGDV